MRFPNLDQTKAWQDFQSLALKPSLLTKSFSKDRLSSTVITSPLLSFFYAYSHLEHFHLDVFNTLIEEVSLFDRVEGLLSGEKINVSENRSVAHHRYRNPKDNCAQQEIETCLDFCMKTRAQGDYDAVLQIGIGGSELGPKAIYEAAKYTNEHQMRAYFLSNLDPVILDAICKKINHKNRFLFVFLCFL